MDCEGSRKGRVMGGECYMGKDNQNKGMKGYKEGRVIRYDVIK